MKKLTLDELKKRPNPGEPGKTKSELITDADVGATTVQGRLLHIPAEADNMKLHYHTEREGWILVLKGVGKEVVEGKEFPIKPGDLMFIPAKEKHRIENTGDTELAVIELYSLPHDFVVVEE